MMEVLRKGEAFPQIRRRSRSQRSHELLIWVGVVFDLPGNPESSRVVGQFVVAALYERRIFACTVAAVSERRISF